MCIAVFSCGQLSTFGYFRLPSSASHFLDQGRVVGAEIGEQYSTPMSFRASRK